MTVPICDFQIDNLEDNFKNFERDYEKSLTDQTKTNKVYEARLEHYQMKLDEANRLAIIIQTIMLNVIHLSIVYCSAKSNRMKPTANC